MTTIRLSTNEDTRWSSALKKAAVYSLIGTMFCMLVYLLIQDVTYMQRIIPSYNTVEVGILTILVDYNRYFDMLQPIWFSMNPFIMSVFAFVFLFIHSISKLTPGIKFLLNLCFTIVFGLSMSYSMLNGIYANYISGTYFWEILIISFFPHVVFFLLSLPSLVSLCGVLLHKKSKNKSKNISFDLIFVGISILLFVYCYWVDF